MLGGGGGGGALTWVLDVWKVYIGVWEPAKVSPYSCKVPTTHHT